MSNQAGFTPMVAEPRRWDFIAGMVNELGFKSVVEVGCKSGRTAGHILKTCPQAGVVAIDPWVVQEKTDDKARETYKDWDFEKIEKEFWENIGEHKDRCQMLRTTSVEAAKQLQEQTSANWDLVFIDALHDYPSVLEDIKVWWPLVKVGGVLMGHDFNHKWPSVERAVADSFDLMDVGLGSDSVWFVVKHV
jgi:predicted O-methyltransferase YrrM